MPPNNPHSLLLVAIASSSLIVLFCVLFFLYLYLSFRRRRSPTLPFDFSSNGSASLCRFRLRDLRSATAGFSPSRLLGRGASASVFRGLLPDGKSVAVKTLSLTSEGSSSPSKSGLEFKNELHVLSTMRPSPFVVNLIGFCESGDCRMLIYEYMPNGSLQQVLFGSTNDCVELSWEWRFGIIVDVAMGLEFLHFGCDPSVVHGDIKPSNVLLGSDFRAKIADFGLAKVKIDCDDGFVSQDVGLFLSQELCSDFEFDFSRAIKGCSSSGNFEGRVRCNPIARLEDVMKGKEATVIPLDNSLECSKELNDGDWWWKQEGSGELNSRHYVSEWIGSQICTPSNTENDLEAGIETRDRSKRKDEKCGGTCGKKSGCVKEWWKEEYFEEISKKTNCNKGLRSLNWFRKSTSGNTRNPNSNRSSIDREMNANVSFRKGSWKKNKKRSKSVGSEMFSGDLFSKELSSTTSMRGTICYVAPEQSGCGQFMEKGDIYSFGVLILVIISGRRPLHVLSSPMKLERANLISWCRQLASSGNVLDLVDERLRDSYNKEQANLCINLALLCLQKMPELRPDSGEIVKILKGEMDLPIVPFEFSPSPNSKMLNNKRRKATCDLEDSELRLLGDIRLAA